MITADQLVAHAIGDYLIQSDWMAAEKTRAHWPAAAHALTYTLPFLALTRSPWRLALIAASHFVIDRWRLARYPVYAKNALAPPGYNPPWSECQGTGYPQSKPAWLAVWLLILGDNTLHAIINGLILTGSRR